METTWILAIIGASIVVLLALRAWALRRRRRARAEYQRVLQQALDDGVLTPDEIEKLDAVRQAGALTAEEVRMAALAIYRVAIRDAAADARLTPDEDATLKRLQQQLGLSERDLGADFNQLSRLRMLARVAEGNMPEVHSPVPLVPDELCHWVVQCTLADRIPLTSPARHELAGTSFPVVSAEPFAAAGARDALRPADDILPTDVGALIITSRRTIFQGAKRTVSVPHARTEQLTLYADGIRLEEIAQSLRRYFLVDDPELTCAILLQAARTRRAEIRPARPTLSA
jgi:cbb3-type cytochrome oxidase subunit 3